MESHLAKFEQHIAEAQERHAVHRREAMDRRRVEAHRRMEAAEHELRAAVEEGGFDRRSVKDALDRMIAEQRVIDGVAGTYVLGPDHDARRAFRIVELRSDGDRELRTVVVD